MCDEDGAAEDYPTEIAESLTGFDSSVGSVNKMVDTMISSSKNELLQKVRKPFTVNVTLCYCV